MVLEIWDNDGIQYGRGYGDEKIMEYWNQIIAGDITEFRGIVKLVDIIAEV